MKTTDKYVFFWNGIYSQWYLRDMVVDGIKYNCCEQSHPTKNTKTNI